MALELSLSWFSLNKNDEIGVVMKIFPPLFLRVVLLLSLGASAISQAEPQKSNPEIETKAIDCNAHNLYLLVRGPGCLGSTVLSH